MDENVGALPGNRGAVHRRCPLRTDRVLLEPSRELERNRRKVDVSLGVEMLGQLVHRRNEGFLLLSRRNLAISQSKNA